jgi:CHASE2 domain-containing sensor protein
MRRHRSAKKKHKKLKPGRERSGGDATHQAAPEHSGPVSAHESTPGHSDPSTVRKGYGGREAALDFLKGLVFIALVFSISLLIGRTTFGKQLKLMSYNLLQLRLTSRSTPVTIVDISDLAPEEFDIDGLTGTATPRAALQEMIEAISEQTPKAIGIDIDFAPDENGYIHPRDPEFFQFCLNLRQQKGIPVFLGVKRTMAKAPSEWLGNEKYQELAGSILVPKDSSRMLRIVRLGDETTAGATTAESRPSKSMSVVLAEAYGRESNQSAPVLSRVHSSVINGLTRLGIIEKFSERRLAPGLSLEDFLIDFGSLDSIETIPTIDAAVLRDPNQRRRFQGKIVLLGDATLSKATDTFVVPARDQPYPGVFLHAAAADTLVKEPLYEVTARGRTVIDLTLSVAILLTIVLIRLGQRHKQPSGIDIHRWEGLLTLLVVVAAIVGGVLFVRSTRVMWDDFFLALTMLVFHPSIERHVKGAGEWIGKHLKLRGRAAQH